MAGPDSNPDFQRGRYLGLIVAGVVVVLGIAAVLALSGVFGKRRAAESNPDNKEVGPREKKVVHVIGYVGWAIEPKAKVDATIHFGSATFHATTRARSHWDQIEPTYAAL